MLVLAVFCFGLAGTCESIGYKMSRDGDNRGLILMAAGICFMMGGFSAL